MLTLAAASLALKVPAEFVNNNCVQDAQWRLREAISLAMESRSGSDEAPSYVRKAVNDLRSWCGRPPV
jgi:hypothetical protein